MTAMTDTWAAIEIGCSTCQQNSRIIGVYRDVDAAIAAADQAYDDHGTACSQYTTEVHRLPAPL